MNPLTQVKAIAFDLDGTLVDSLPGLADAVDRVMEESGLEKPGEARVRGWVGKGPYRLLEYAIQWGDPLKREWDFTCLQQRFQHYYRQSMEAGTRLYPGVRETLASLAQQGWTMAVVSNKPSVFIPPMLAALTIDSFFVDMIGGDDTPRHKPHPASLYLLLGRLGLKPAQLLLVGDSRNDILAAQEAGCPCIGVSYGYNHGESIADYHPDWVVDEFPQLLSLIPAATLCAE